MLFRSRSEELALQLRKFGFKLTKMEGGVLVLLGLGHLRGLLDFAIGGVWVGVCGPPPRCA